VTARPASRISSIWSTGTPDAFEISSSVGCRSSCAASSRSVRAIFRSRWPMWTGMRIVRARFATPRWIAWRIQKVAYVENL
jgi:hypothetical protein